MAWLYVLHFDEPYHHARHYLGWTGRDVESRLKDHLSGNGSRLVKAVVDAGIAVRVVYRQPVTLANGREEERRLKRQKGVAMRLCPECRQATLERRAESQNLRRALKRLPPAAE